MFTLMIAVELIISILLILAVLMQSSKGGGLAGSFGGGNVGVVFGVRRTADFLTRATQILAGAFLLLALVINIFFLPRAGTSTESVLQQQGQQRTMQPQLPPPAEQQAPVQ
jgi:preprotein translocase subunit SecG